MALRLYLASIEQGGPNSVDRKTQEDNAMVW